MTSSTNILISEADGEMVPKIADFGLAKLIHAMADDAAMTKEGMFMGFGYMAPEQLKDARSVDGRADIFSLGAILYEMVCGQRCFEGQGVYEVLSAIQPDFLLRGRFILPSREDGQCHRGCTHRRPSTSHPRSRVY